MQKQDGTREGHEEGDGEGDNKYLLTLIDTE